MKAVVLAGDSVIDNGSYVNKGQPSVSEQIIAALNPRPVISVALDGGIIADTVWRLKLKGLDPSHIVISVGGNDALEHEHLLNRQELVTVEALLDYLAQIRTKFAADYEIMLKRIMGRYKDVNLVVSTIYYPTFRFWDLQRRAIPLLAIFNDVILSLATIHRLPVLDLRWISTQVRHYANSIEPSAEGGERIAETIARIVKEHDFSGPSSIYAYPGSKFRAQPFVRGKKNGNSK